MLDSPAAYPPWLVVACAAAAGIALLWLLLKLLKAALWLLFFGALVAGVAAVVWLLFGQS